MVFKQPTCVGISSEREAGEQVQYLFLVILLGCIILSCVFYSKITKSQTKAVISLENQQLRSYALEPTGTFFSDVDRCFQMVSSDYCLFFCDFLSHRYTDMQIRRHRCSRFLAIDACLFTEIVFLLSRIATKIDFCGATGHDHGGW